MRRLILLGGAAALSLTACEPLPVYGYLHGTRQLADGSTVYRVGIEHITTGERERYCRADNLELTPSMTSGDVVNVRDEERCSSLIADFDPGGRLAGK